MMGAQMSSCNAIFSTKIKGDLKFKKLFINTTMAATGVVRTKRAIKSFDFSIFSEGAFFRHNEMKKTTNKSKI